MNVNEPGGATPHGQRLDYAAVAGAFHQWKALPVVHPALKRIAKSQSDLIRKHGDRRVTTTRINPAIVTGTIEQPTGLHTPTIYSCWNYKEDAARFVVVRLRNGAR